MTDIELRLIIETILKDEKLLKQLKTDLENLDKAGKKADQGGLKGFFKNMESGIKTIGMFTGAVGIAALALRQGFNLAQQGAQIQQLSQSFESLEDRLGLTIDLEEELARAAGGTITAAGQQASIMMLLAGTSGDTAVALAEATPRLLEIARAANRLNPTLGSTEELFAALATGIKRGSPLMIDNTGLTLRLGEANRTFAESLGISVDEMTAAQRTQALLNATLEAGSVLMEQAGDASTNMADDYARLTVSIAEIINKLKVLAGEGLVEAVQTIQLLITWNDRLNEGFQESIVTNAENAESYDDYARNVIRSNQLLQVSTGDFFGFMRSGVGAFRTLVSAGFDVDEANRIIAQSYGALTEEQIRFLESHELLERELTEAEGVESFDRALLVAAGSAEILTDANEDVVRSLFDINQASRTAIEGAMAVRTDLAAAFADEPLGFEINVGVASDIERAIAQIDFAEAGGVAVENMRLEIGNRLAQGLVTPAQAREAFAMLEGEAIAVGVRTGELTATEGARRFAEVAGISYAQAFALIQGSVDGTAIIDMSGIQELTQEGTATFRDEMESVIEGLEVDVPQAAQTGFDLADVAAGEFAGSENIANAIEQVSIIASTLQSIPGTYQANVIITNAVGGNTIAGSGVGGGGEIAGFASGVTNYVIPPGFANDSFMAGFTSGEILNVTPNGGGAPGGAGGDVNISMTVVSNDPERIADQLAIVLRRRGKTFADVN